MKTNFTNKTFLRVRYGETDQMGYCYYGNYAQYFEVGRVECLRSLGMSYKQLEENGIMLPVVHFSVNYKIPALYDDELCIETQIKELGAVKITFDYKIFKNETLLVCEASTTLVFVNKENMKPIAAPVTFTQLLKEFEVN